MGEQVTTQPGVGEALTVEQIRAELQRLAVDAVDARGHGAEAEAHAVDVATRLESLAASTTGQNAHPDVLGAIATLTDFAATLKSAAASYAEAASELNTASGQAMFRLNRTDGVIAETAQAVGHIGATSLYGGA